MGAIFMKFGRVPTTDSTLRGFRTTAGDDSFGGWGPRPPPVPAGGSPRVPTDIDAKQAAIEQWTADPCGANASEGEPGSRAYFERLLKGTAERARYLGEELEAAGAGGPRVLDVGSLLDPVGRLAGWYVFARDVRAAQR